MLGKMSGIDPKMVKKDYGSKSIKSKFKMTINDAISVRRKKKKKSSEDEYFETDSEMEDNEKGY
jgi:hypothetical protein